MKNIIGSFVFRDEGDGCLTSKYINRGMTSALTESAKLQGPKSKNKFCGKYFSVWLDSPVDQNHSFLEITQTPGNDDYELTWSNSKHPVLYKGQGMLFGDLLVGSYWSYNLEKLTLTAGEE